MNTEQKADVIIEPLIKSDSAVPFIKKGNFMVQSIAFELGFRITNIGDTPSAGFTIANIVLRSADSQNLKHTIEKSYHVGTLNPGQSEEVWVEKLGTYMHGLASIEASVLPDTDGIVIQTYQKDWFTKDVSKCKQNNWLDFVYVISRSDETQNANNQTMLFLTVVMAIVTVINILLALQYQVKPVLDIRAKNAFEARNYCEQNPEGVWPKETGGTFNCSEVLEFTQKTYSPLLLNK